MSHPEQLFAIDLFSGMEGATAAMRERGWRVVTLDLEERFRPSVVGDVRNLPFREGLRPDLLWASPPCDEFSKSYMPWHHVTEAPDLSLVWASLNAVRLLEPRWWVIENVAGAVRWLRPILGPHVYRLGPVHLWGHMPALLLGDRIKPWKERLSSTQSDLRARIPFAISEAVALAVEAAA